MPASIPHRTRRIAGIVAFAALTLALAAAAGAANIALPDGCVAAGSAAGRLPSQRTEEPFPPVQLQMRTPQEPTVIRSGAVNFLLYELHVHNFAADAVSLRGIQVLDADKPDPEPIAQVTEAQLNAQLRRITLGDQAGDKRSLDSGQGVVAYLCLAFSKSAPVPGKLRHRILLQDKAVDGPTVGTRATRLHSLGRPLVGADWSPDNNPSLHSHHRMGLWVAGGVARISRRYALDWKKYGKDGQSWSGDQRDVHAYHAYGAKTIAVAGGTVVAAVDGYPDNVPRSPAGFAPAVPVTPASVAGNRIVIDLGDGQFAYYAHLQPGSVRVKAGQKVRRGQWLARVGNSGDAREPHLHFQVTDGPDILASEGLPHVFDRYAAKSGDGAWESRAHEYPMGDVVVDFGPEDAMSRR
ncbi:MAG TPA: M23 family metallopeptidase [Telluria sp.]